MNPLIYITTSLGSCLTIALIFINYITKFDTDNFQRKLFLILLSSAFVAVTADFFSRFFAGRPGGGINVLMYSGISLFHIAQNCTYYFGFIFTDYLAYKNIKRSKKLMFSVIIFLAVYAVSVIANLPLGFYFSVSLDNLFVRGNLYPLRLILSYCSALLIIVNILFAAKYYKLSHTYFFILFILITGLGAALDIFFREGSLVWPCFAAAVLYLYFFILQYDSRIDSLTGIGNRYSFNEFIEKLSRRSTRAEYSVVMIDMDRFKDINDILGHLEGDNALRDLSAIIKGVIRREDFAARYGGDEFILATDAKNDIQRIMNRIQTAIDEQNEKRVRPYQLYISYGYGTFTTHASHSVMDFIAGIDAMMYKNKEERKRRGIPSAITANIPNNQKSEEKNV